MGAFVTYNFPTLIAGAYFNGANFTLYSDEAKTEPIDLSGAVITINLRKGFNLPVAWAFSSQSGSNGNVVITDASGGKFSIIGVNMAVDPGTYVYDIQIEHYTGEIKKPVLGSGLVVYSPEVSPGPVSVEVPLLSSSSVLYPPVIFSLAILPFSRWNGSAWVPVKGRIWNGSAWVPWKFKMWNGSQWQDI